MRVKSSLSGRCTEARYRRADRERKEKEPQKTVRSHNGKAHEEVWVQVQSLDGLIGLSSGGGFHGETALLHLFDRTSSMEFDGLEARPTSARLPGGGLFGGRLDRTVGPTA